MKFCYIDESGIGNEPFAVMVGVIVDAHRMRPTKANWDDLLTTLSRFVGREIAEIHTRDFYAGNGPWRSIDGSNRAHIIGAILKWIAKRKHELVFCTVDKGLWNNQFRSDKRYQDVNSLWRFLGLHLVLAIQKKFQTMKSNKGNTVLIFDNEEHERVDFTDLILNPPSWTETYYNRGHKQEPLDQIVDAPYFADSKHVPMLQVADFIAFLIRRYLELENGDRERYEGERRKVAAWASAAKGRAIASSNTYPKRNRCECSDIFFEYAPGTITSK